MHVRFLKDFDYRPSGAFGVTVAYRAGQSYTVKRECAERAIAAKAAVKTRPPPRTTATGGDNA